MTSGDRLPRNVRSDEQTRSVARGEVGCQQRTVGCRRFNSQHIHRRTGYGAAAQRFSQVGLVDDGTASSVDEHRRPLHSGEGGCAKKPASLVGERSVDGDDVGLSEHLVEADLAHVSRDGIGRLRGGRDDVHTEGVGYGRHTRANVAQAVHAHGQSFQLLNRTHGEGEVGRGHPPTGGHRPRVATNVDLQLQQQREHRLRHRSSAVSRYVAHRDAPP